jgi:YD repeat-containing protein
MPFHLARRGPTSSSNRIASITPASGPLRSFVFDPNGSTTADGNNTYAYDTRGHLIAETDPGGAVKREIFYLGDIPVGVVQ